MEPERALCQNIVFPRVPRPVLGRPLPCTTIVAGPPRSSFQPKGPHAKRSPLHQIPPHRKVFFNFSSGGNCGATASRWQDQCFVPPLPARLKLSRCAHTRVETMRSASVAIALSSSSLLLSMLSPSLPSFSLAPPFPSSSLATVVIAARSTPLLPSSFLIDR